MSQPTPPEYTLALTYRESILAGYASLGPSKLAQTVTAHALAPETQAALAEYRPLTEPPELGPGAQELLLQIANDDTYAAMAKYWNIKQGVPQDWAAALRGRFRSRTNAELVRRAIEYGLKIPLVPAQLARFERARPAPAHWIGYSLASRGWTSTDIDRLANRHGGDEAGRKVPAIAALFARKLLFSDAVILDDIARRPRPSAMKWLT